MDKEIKNVDSLTHDQLILEINRLSSLSKTRELNSEEKEYRMLLRKRYLHEFKQGFDKHLKNIKVVDKNGNEVKKTKNQK